jgi:hypothetical protein
METLEIKVFDTITTVDTLVQAVEYVIEVIRKWFTSDDKQPLDISLKKLEDRGPPSLKINVTDTVSAKGGLV